MGDFQCCTKVNKMKLDRVVGFQQFGHKCMLWIFEAWMCTMGIQHLRHYPQGICIALAPMRKKLSVKPAPSENTSYLQISSFTVLSGGAFLRPVSSRPLCLGPSSKGAILWKLQQRMRAFMGRTCVHQRYFRQLGLIKIRPQKDVNAALGIFVCLVQWIVFSASLIAFYPWGSDSRSVFIIKIILLCCSNKNQVLPTLQ